MSVAPVKLYYRRGGVTYSCELYTTTTDTGSPYLGVRSGGTTYYAALEKASDSRASYLRTQSGGLTYAVLSSVYSPTWTNFGSKSPSGYGYVSTTYSNIALNYYKLYSSSSLYNIKITYTVSGTAGSSIVPKVEIDGTTYSAGTKTPGTYYAYFRLSTGNHTIKLFAEYEDWGDEGSVQFSSVGDKVLV